MRFSEFAPLNEANYSPGQFAMPGYTPGPTAPKKPGFLARNFTPTGRVLDRAIKIFKDKFVKQLKYNAQVSKMHGVDFDLQGFVDGYLKTNKWDEKAYALQLQKAIAAGPGLLNNYSQLADVMATIGQANTQMYSKTGSSEIAGSSTAHASPSAIPNSGTSMQTPASSLQTP